MCPPFVIKFKYFISFEFLGFWKISMKLMETLWLFSMVDHSSSTGMIWFCFLSSSFQCSITNQLDDLLPVGLLAQLVECCTERCRRSQGFEYCPNLIFFFTTTKFLSTAAMIVFHLMMFFFSLSLFYNSLVYFYSL